MKVNLSLRMKGDTSRGTIIEDVKELRFAPEGTIIVIPRDPDGELETVDCAAHVVSLEFEHE
jgi:hypothetical protein